MRFSTRVSTRKAHTVLVLAIFILGLSAVSVLALDASINPTDTPSLNLTQAQLAAIDISQIVTVSQCAPCHGSNLDKFNNPALIFKHDPHLARGIRCAACHDQFPHAPGAIKRPSMTVCYSCHGVRHSTQGLVASGDCTLCHPAGFKRLPADHTAAFKAKDHKVPARADSYPCRSCHGDAFCVKCHNAKQVRPANHTLRLPANQKTPPTPQQLAAKANVETTWKKIHGIERDKGGCEICHNVAYCNSKCHKTPMPHPGRWLGEHKQVKKSIALRTDCKTCHQGKTECSSCHHKFEGSTLLIQNTCKSCHDEYTKPLSALISSTPHGQRSKGIIIHKAHFEMTKTDPFDCDECHGRSYVTAKSCFSFELCYECHGRTRGGSLIAKWGGQELCYRCHQRK